MLSPPIDPQFGRLLEDFEREAIAVSEDVVYGMWPDLTLAYFNHGWNRFAEANSGQPAIRTEWTLGRRLLDAIAEPLHPFFIANYRRCLEERRPWEHTYECSSATVYRTFHMVAYPLGESEGLLVVNSLRLMTEHTRESVPATDGLYRNQHGMVTQCCHCRRVRRPGVADTWDWVREWVATQPPATSHGICPACFGFHYSPLRDQRQGFMQPFQATFEGP